jgi:hypothetical protein
LRWSCVGTSWGQGLGQGFEIDRAVHRNCRHGGSAAALVAGARNGRRFGRRIVFGEAPFGVTAYAVMAGLYLADIASDTAGDVGAVHHDMSPEASSIS